MKNSANINYEFSQQAQLLSDMVNDPEHDGKMLKHAEIGYALACNAQELIPRYIYARDHIEDTERFQRQRWVLERCIAYLKQVEDGVFRTQFFQLPGRKMRAYEEMQVRVSEMDWYIGQVERVLNGQKPEIEQ